MLKNVISIIKSRRMRWAGHVERRVKRKFNGRKETMHKS